MGERPELILEGCRRAVDMGVYPFVVPLRPVPGTPLGDVLPPAPEYMESVYRRVVPYLVARGLGSWTVRAGCARCQACSAMTAMERSLGHDGRASLPLLEIR
ncbi:MAG: MSMEG_0568 family radical SAM protein, partial [Actinomycetes bacterium]